MMNNTERTVRFIRLDDGKVLCLDKNFFSLKRSQKEFIGKKFAKYFKMYLEENRNIMPTREDLRDEIFPNVYFHVEQKKIAITKENLWIYMYQFTHKLLESYYPEFVIGEKEKEVLKSYGCKLK